jgi:hypothetical protein
MQKLTAKDIKYAKSFWEIRPCISRGSRSSCLGAQGKSADVIAKNIIL